MKAEKTCDDCAHVNGVSMDEDGNVIIDCELNEFQMYAPRAEECKHWEKALGEE